MAWFRTHGVLKVNDKLRLVPAIATRPATCTTGMSASADGVVESVWPVSARGKAY
jgi:3-hydroxy-D-aspartate aldolase